MPKNQEMPPRPKMAPAKIDVLLNEFAKLFVVTAVFFMEYALFYEVLKSSPIFLQISLLVTLNLVATIISYLIAYFIITRRLLYRKYAARGFFTINDMPEKLPYVLLSLIVNPIVSAFFIYDYLLVLNLDPFFILSVWIAIKLFFMAMEYFMSEKMKQNVIIMGALIIIFLVMLFSAANIMKRLMEGI